VSTSPSSTPASPRREFIARVATATAALAGTACASPAAAQAVAASSSTPARGAPRDGNDAWAARITGKHRVVFDAPEIADGIVTVNAWVYLNSYENMYGLTDADLSVVVVIRHHAIAMAVDDALWEKYDLGHQARIKDPATKRWARRNIYWRTSPAGGSGSEFTLDALRQRGAILLGCALAARRFAGTIAEQTKQRAEDVHAEIRAHLIPGLELAPSGIFAVTRAQEAGCTFVRST
jgi:hypothetical protein